VNTGSKQFTALRCKMIAPLFLDVEEMRRRQERYDRLAGESIAITLFNLPAVAPRRLEDAEDIEHSASLVQREIDATDPVDFDAVMPDCVLDPCVGEIVATPVPLYGILRLAGSALTSLGEPFTAVTRNRAIGEELRRKLELYGLSESLSSLSVLDADFCLIADDAGWAEAMGPLVEATARGGVHYLLNGCSAVDIQPSPGAVCVVDPTRLALQVLVGVHKSGVLPSGETGTLPEPCDREPPRPPRAIPNGGTE